MVTVYDGKDPRLSADGRFVAYAANFGPDDLDTNSGRSSVYLRDRETGLNELISRSATGSPISPGSCNPSISADGRYVSFAGATSTFPSVRDVYVRGRLLGTTEQINIGTGLTGVSFAPTMDATGRFVTFHTTTTSHVYLRDREAATTELATVATDGTPWGGVGTFGVFDSSWYSSSVSSNGAVVFWPSSSNLVPNDLNNVHDIFMRRIRPGTGGGTTTPLANLGGPYVGWASSAAVPAGIWLDGSGSLDPGGAALTGHWNFGDGSTPADGALVMNHSYSQPGVFQVTLTVDSGGEISAPVQTEVEVLQPLPAGGISVSACAPTGGTIKFDGAASAANPALIANGWDTSTGRIQTNPATIILPWGQVIVPVKLPGLTFTGSALVPPGTIDGRYTAAVSGGPGSRPFKVPCAKSANLPPLAVAGGPIDIGTPGAPVTLDGTGSSDPENATLSYRWDFGDGTSGTGATPTHVYQYSISYFVTSVVNDGTQDSAVMVGTRSFAMVQINLAPTAARVPVSGKVLTLEGRGVFKVRLTMINANGDARSSTTNQFGCFHFDDVEAGRTSVIGVRHKRFQFPNETRVIYVGDAISDLIFNVLPD